MPGPLSVNRMETLFVETDVRYRAEVRDLDGESVVLLWETPVGTDATALGDILRLDTVDKSVARVRWYYFCPETLSECGRRLGIDVRTHGYGYP